MIDESLLRILVCPENHTALQVADEELVAKINEAIAGGALKNRLGEAVTEAIHGGLVREDATLLYPVRNDIPVMLVDEAIPLEGIA